MPTTLPCTCGGEMTYRKTRKNKSGLSHEFRCRRFKECGRRATYGWANGMMVRKSFGARPKLTREMVREAFLSPLSARRMADQLNVSASLVKDIRIGRTYAEVTADLRGVKREDQHYCSQCIHYLKGCTMGFPEARNARFADYCTLFSKKQLAPDWVWKEQPLEIAA